MTHDDRLAKLTHRFFPGAVLGSVSPLAGGVSASVSLLELAWPDGATRQVVLREHGRTHNGHDAGTEYGLLKSLHARGLPVPKPIAAGAASEWLDHPFVLLEFVAGTTQIDEAAAATAIDAMASQLVAIHQTPIAGLPPLPRRLDPLPELLGFLPPNDEWAPLRARLLSFSNSGYAGAPTLLHGDFWPGNVIWSGAKIAAVLDWEDAAIGDPLSDVACTCLELRYVFGEDGAQRFKAAYARRREIDDQRFALWQAYVAAAAYSQMGNWGLAPAREDNMRKCALATIREAADSLGAG